MLKLVAKHSLPVELRLGLTVAAAALPSVTQSRPGLAVARRARTRTNHQGPADHLDHDLFDCSSELALSVEHPASTGGRRVGLVRSARASWAEAKLGPNSKHKFEIFQGSSSCALNLNHHDGRSCEFLVLLLFSLFNYNKT